MLDRIGTVSYVLYGTIRWCTVRNYCTGILGGTNGAAWWQGESDLSSGLNGYRVLTNDRASCGLAAWDERVLLKKVLLSLALI